ncbi:hypothetical protein SAMN02910263_02394 [Butyrivibrio sp. INlla16]|nr:hypothetical protein SAMN02910263_02394 [Butyrivibrio sp. INlla16]
MHLHVTFIRQYGKMSFPGYVVINETFTALSAVSVSFFIKYKMAKGIIK